MCIIHVLIQFPSPYTSFIRLLFIRSFVHSSAQFKGGGEAANTAQFASRNKACSVTKPVNASTGERDVNRV